MVSKRIFDLLLAVLLSFILFVPFLCLWLITSIDTKDNGLFTQKRIGYKAKEFTIYKFRTLKGKYDSSITTRKMEITPLGKLMRKYGIDEIPQLINILNGTMSFVGPRPDVEGYADKLEGEDRIILKVRPGITGPAQLKFRNESEILNSKENPKEYNDTVLWGDKVKINKEYVKNRTLLKDIGYIIKTIF